MSFRDSIIQNRRTGGLLLSTALAVAVAAFGGVAASADAAAAVEPAAAYAQNSYADVLSRVTPAVVTVRASRRSREARQFPFMDDPTLRELFGDRFRQQMPRGEERLERGLGSGVIVSADGYILTNHHVIDGAQEIRVELNDGRTLAARVVGSDAPSDLAVLKVEATGLPVLTLGDSDKARVGDVALAVGNPLGVGQTVTSGIISAKGRSTGISDGSFEDFIQTDAAINRGNSGGALVNTSGELIGINSQIFSPTGGNIGIGFAIPSNMAKDVMGQLIKTGRVRRGMLGVNIQNVTADLASSLGLGQARGAIVSGVQAGGPADRAGVRRGDVITAFNGTPVTDNNTLRNAVARTQPGAVATLTVSRDNREQQLRVTLGELPAAGARGESEESTAAQEESGGLGLSVQPVSPALVQRFNLKGATAGLVITDVAQAGAGAEAGLQPGDVIEEVNRRPVRTAAELQAALKASGERPALLLVNRGGDALFLPVRPRAQTPTR
ncbi:MAG TPA: DegQ family serine endoprotease [Pyrinomonadaceae bacterium]|nr:DegQ family serine endoprotease [Pyrinomonadaceae bacterium]